MSFSNIIYTETDEAPALATRALYPIFQRFLKPLGITLTIADISVAGRILCQFPEVLSEEQKGYARDTLTELGELCKTEHANIIKLPNISASIPQLLAAIKELQAKGFKIPDYPANPTTDAERDIKARYGKVVGSAVNPVLREGNSDRRVAAPVKAYAQANPHRLYPWSQDSKARVAHMESGDFFESERSYTAPAATTLKVVHVAKDGTESVLKDGIKVQQGEVVDAARMSVKALHKFYADAIAAAKADGVLFSLHLKATMMKVSDPILFGHCVEAFFRNTFTKHAATLAKAGADPRLGLGNVLERVAALGDEGKAVLADFDAELASNASVAMVDSSKGITNLHVPSDVIIDASMPCVVRDGGKMWNKDDKLQEVLCAIPDRSYATSYQACLDFVRSNGQFDVRTMGTVPNVGLMAQKAEEYGSHDKTFEMAADGVVKVVDASGATVHEHAVEKGDIWRACQTKDAPIRDWVKLAVSRAKASGWPTVFWLDSSRAHDAEIMKKVEVYLKEHDTTGLDIRTMRPQDAMTFSCERAKRGENTISVTGNVLRDYLTDLFPILELGTSAKMLSIVPMLAGGSMYETGAGGSAPKHVQQFVEEGHLRWDSLGEYLAMSCSLEDVATRTSCVRTKLAADTLTKAISMVLDNNKSPSRKVKEIDNRGTHYWLARYWADALSKEDESFKSLAASLAEKESEILSELIECQGKAIDIGGYYLPDGPKADAAMNPSPTLASILKTDARL